MSLYPTMRLPGRKALFVRVRLLVNALPSREKLGSRISNDFCSPGLFYRKSSPSRSLFSLVPGLGHNYQNMYFCDKLCHVVPNSTKNQWWRTSKKQGMTSDATKFRTEKSLDAARGTGGGVSSLFPPRRGHRELTIQCQHVVNRVKDFQLGDQRNE